MTCYITTAIPFVNARPHLGHAFEAVLADALVRHQRRRGRDVRFATGTDEHSLKNVLAAEAAGEDTAAWVARRADDFRALLPALDVAPDRFVRTSAEPGHRAAVEALWRRLAAAGDLYRTTYRGRYCVGCERFADDEDGATCPEHNTPYEDIAEDNWFFRLSRHAARVADAIVHGELVIEPAAAREETLAFLAGPVRDLSVSRSAARARGWGIPVPGDAAQVVYVWVDALAYYLTALDWGDAPGDAYRRYWEDGERVHVVGKGILRFHTVVWPALLASARLPLPSRVLVHGYVTVDGAKISKSGVSVDPVPLAARLGVSGLRHALLGLRTTRDGDFSEARAIADHDAALARQLGNWVQRTATLAHRQCGGVVPGAAPDGDPDGDPDIRTLRAAVAELPGRVDAAIARFALDDALAAVHGVVAAGNGFLERTAPWRLARGDRDAASAASAAIRASLDAIAAVAGELSPFAPGAAASIAAALGVDPSGGLVTGAALPPPRPLFTPLQPRRADR